MGAVKSSDTNDFFYWLHTCNRIYFFRWLNYIYQVLQTHHLSFPFIYYLLKCSKAFFFLLLFFWCVCASFKQIAIYSHLWSILFATSFPYHCCNTFDDIFALYIDYILYNVIFLHSCSILKLDRLLLISFVLKFYYIQVHVIALCYHCCQSHCCHVNYKSIQREKERKKM